MSNGVYAAVMTGKGVGAISTIQVIGPKAHNIISKIFTPSANHKLEPGKISLGNITDNTSIIDQVTIGCETFENFHINCHGNPLIVSDIMRLLNRKKVKLLTAEQLLAKTFHQQGLNAITIEAKINLLKAKTAAGSRLITNQIQNGLGKSIGKWFKGIKSTPLEKIKEQAIKILEASKTARMIIFGCKAVLIGPPNSGKSTLLNCLTGQDKAIVTEIAGTTRDWVSGSLNIEPLFLELTDTAGVEEALLNTSNAIDRESQKRSIGILENSDLVLLVLDSNKEAPELSKRAISKLANKRILTVLNKSDLLHIIDLNTLPDYLIKNFIEISAKHGSGIKELKQKILEICDVSKFKLNSPACITDRQGKLLNKLVKARTKQSATSIIEKLLNDRVFV